MSDNRLIVFDTTLRDGEQSPGASMNLAEKLEIAHALAELGVDVIEAGFPIASPGDFEAVQSVAQQVQGPVICGLARCNEADIDRAWEALREATKARIHVFLATSSIHREFKLKMAKEEIVRRAVEGSQRARLSAMMSNSRRRTPHAPNWSSWPRSSRKSSKSERPRSTSPIRSATRCRSSTQQPSAI